jgi:hypothetical protein
MKTSFSKVDEIKTIFFFTPIPSLGMINLNRIRCQIVNGISGAKNSKDISALICPEVEKLLKIIQNWGLGKMLMLGES